MQITKNFHSDEFACKDGSKKILIDVDLVSVLQKIRDELGSAITVNSGYRTEEYNRRPDINGAKNSYHLKGRAFDISSKAADPYKLAKLAERQGIKGIIRYLTFTHIDSRETKYWFDNVYNQPVATFFSSVLKYGSIEPEVRTLQRFLGVKVDGIFGNQTLAAVKKFQADNHLTADGVVGKNTIKKLEEHMCFL